MNKKYEGLYSILLGKSYFKLDDIMNAKDFLKQANDYYKIAPLQDEEEKMIQELTENLESDETRNKEEANIERLQNELDKNPENNDIRYKLSVMLMKFGKYEESANQCLNILKIDRNWNNGKAKMLITELLPIVGSSSELALYIRKELIQVLHN